MAAKTRLGLGGPSGAYLGFVAKAAAGAVASADVIVQCAADDTIVHIEPSDIVVRVPRG